MGTVTNENRCQVAYRATCLVLYVLCVMFSVLF